MKDLEEKKKIKKDISKNEKFSTKNMLPISEIRDDTIILKDWWLRAIIKVWGLNLDLKSYEEQQIAVQQYKRFLNWLDFPIQILIRSTYLDITDYIQFLKTKVNNIENDVLKWYWEEYLKFLEKINLTQWIAYSKEFYIIVPYYPLNDNKEVKKSWFTKLLNTLTWWEETPEKIVARYRDFLKNKKHLDTRCNIIIEGLKSLWMIAERLKVDEIISLLFKVYNPYAHKSQAEFKR